MTTLLRRATILLSLLALRPATADFTTPLSNLTTSQTVNLTWSPPSPLPPSTNSSSPSSSGSPYILTLTLLNQTSTSTFGLKTNISTTITGSAYLWTDIPAPAPFIPTALYQLEVKSETGETVARSEFFGIGEGMEDGDGGGGDGRWGWRRRGWGSGDGVGGDGDKGQRAGPNKVAIAVGVIVGVAGTVALGVVAWCLRRRGRRVQEERRRRKRMEFVIS